MSAVLDTSVLIGLEQGRLPRLDVPADAVLSVLTLEELWLGVRASGAEVLDERRRTFRLASTSFVILPVDERAAVASADIRAEGRERGRRYQLGDSLIAGTARVHGLPLYTQDEGMLGMTGVDVRVV